MALARRVAYVSILDLGSRMAHGVQVMKNAQAWAGAVEGFEFITNLGLLSRLRLDEGEVRQRFGLSRPFAMRA